MSRGASPKHIYVVEGATYPIAGFVKAYELISWLIGNGYEEHPTWRVYKVPVYPDQGKSGCELLTHEDLGL